MAAVPVSSTNTRDENNLKGGGSAKQPKFEDNSTIHTILNNFEGFVLDRVISDNSQRKTITIVGSFKEKEGVALIVLERKPFTKENLTEILNGDSKLHQEFANDIYGNYECYPEVEYNGIKTTVIHPATEKHIKKFEAQPKHILQETPHLYSKITVTYLEKEQFTLDWLFNILDHKSEVDRIVFEDPHPVTGFILLPDLKWNAKQVEDLYLLGVVRKRGIKSLRDITAEHLPLLRNLYSQGIKAIEEKYNIPGSQLRIYIHYQPSFYHLHVHYTYLTFDAPGIFTEKSHLLSTVINNIELMPDYYQKATLPFVVKESDGLFQLYDGFGEVKKILPINVSAQDKD